MTKEQVKHMVDRFLRWPIPEDFSPDGGISVVRPNYAPGVEWSPSGTNLLTAAQAEAMVRYMGEGLAEAEQYHWLIEAPGPYWLTVRNIGHQHKFHWSADHTEAIRFQTGRQADATMMAIRTTSPELFAFAALLADARAVEHGWLRE